MKLTHIYSCLTLLVTSCVGFSASAEMDAHDWLEQVPLAVQMTNFEGTFIYQRGQQTDVMHITHSSDKNGERERLFSLSGPKREVIRNNKMVTCVLGDKQSVILNRSRPRDPFPVSFPGDLAQIEKNYHFELTGEARIAGLKCQRILIRPLDNYRYGRVLCAEKDTYMLLQTELIDDRGNVIESIMYTDISFPDSIDDKKLRPVYQDASFQWVREKDLSFHRDKKHGVMPSGHWNFQNLPPGFMQTSHFWHDLTEDNPGVEHWVFSDGLASVSLYIEKAAPGDEKYAGISRRGALNAFGTMVNNYHVTALGEVPLKTLETFGKSVRYQP
ncbi:MAG: MucB/RseB C-terminal domain-containing protein [Gammaproteobacteria bacterium]